VGDHTSATSTAPELVASIIKSRAAARCYVLLGDPAAARDMLLAWTREPNLSPEAIARALVWGRRVGLDV
jgi:hypothetical protein